MRDPQQQPVLADVVLARLDALQRGVADIGGELEHAQRLSTIGLLTAGIAHEINNLLTPALGYSHLAKKRSDDPELLGRALDRISEAVETSCRILSTVLDFASPDAIDGTTADVAATVDRTVECLDGELRKHRVRLVIEVAPELYAGIDPLALRQIVMNLVLNAAHALPPDGGDIGINVTRREDRIIFAVRDNGPGVPAELRERIFDPFVRGGADDSCPGSGLGLAICQRLVHAAGGTIDVTDTTGGGATFTVDLPAADAPILSR